MKRKVILGLLMFIAGILLDELSYIADIWIIGSIGKILWIVGSTIGINALTSLKKTKKTD